ncbi:MAG TPA: tripartite tricarboxylate transporter substrate binding protein [Afifellaceae bacterium]|nr:tripartite tricarboxylate transporter substrate binding protein [Afifellaceae bacterium]
MKYGIQTVVSALVLGLAATVTGTQAAQDFPSGPIEFVIPFGAGGGADLEGRLLAQEMEKHLGVKLIPVNKIGGGGAVTYTYIKNSPPDGTRVAWSSSSVLTTTNLGNTDFPYDAMDHIGMVEYQPQPLVVRADSKWKTLDDFAADCKANPGTIKIANGGTGSSTHAAAIAVAEAMGCEVIHLPKGIKDRNKSLLNGESDAMVGPLTGVLNLTKAGKFRILASLSAKRNPVIPDVPTAMELGYDVNVDLFRSLTVPKGTPKEIKDKLADAMKKAAESPAFTDLAAKSGFTIEPMNSEEFSAYLSKEDEKYKEIFAKAGLSQAKSN